MVQHTKTPLGTYYCHGHRASFERQEAEAVAGYQCPWCGESVEVID